MASVLFTLAETIRRIAILVQPFVPTAAGRILDQLAVGEGARSFATITGDTKLVPGIPLPKPEGVFPRFVDEAA